MLKKEAETGKGGRVIIMDAITKVTPDDRGAVVVSASHGGASSGEFALEVPLKAVFFNDAGVGKENAGITALDMLQARGVAAGTVAHTSARIGDAQDMWDNGATSMRLPEILASVPAPSCETPCLPLSLAKPSASARRRSDDGACAAASADRR